MGLLNREGRECLCLGKSVCLDVQLFEAILLYYLPEAFLPAPPNLLVEAILDQRRPSACLTGPCGLQF